MNDNELRIMESLIKKRINSLLTIANENYKQFGWNEAHEKRMARIDGMTEVLQMLTDKDYYYTENGLKTR